MVVEIFEICLILMFVYEGGYVNYFDDFGGVMNWGVIQCIYNVYWWCMGLLIWSVKQIIDDEVKVIYCD